MFTARTAIITDQPVPNHYEGRLKTDFQTAFYLNQSGFPIFSGLFSYRTGLHRTHIVD